MFFRYSLLLPAAILRLQLREVCGACQPSERRSSACRMVKGWESSRESQPRGSQETMQRV